MTASHREGKQHYDGPRRKRKDKIIRESDVHKLEGPDSNMFHSCKLLGPSDRGGQSFNPRHVSIFQNDSTVIVTKNGIWKI
jgi:hypothetical protein